MAERLLKLAKTHDFRNGTGAAGLTVVFIHGIASDSSAFGKTLAYLERREALKNVRFVAFDLLGAGESAKSDALEYDYKEQLTALHNAIEELGVDGPLVLVGHSMGTLIATRYAAVYGGVQALVLCSPPIYTPDDLDNPAMLAGTHVFMEAVSMKNREILDDKAFVNSMEKIVLDRDNYKTLSEIRVPTTLIYGDLDQFIGAFNIPLVVKANPEHIVAIKTPGRHGMSREKYEKISRILTEVMDECAE